MNQEHEPIDGEIYPDTPMLDDLKTEALTPTYKPTRLQDATLYQLALRDLKDPKDLAIRMGTFLESFRELWASRCQPENFVRFTDRDGNSLYRPNAQAGLAGAKIYAISYFNIRPLNKEKGVPEPHITKDGGIIEAEIWADGHCGLTGETVVAIRGARRSNEKFIGRGTMKNDGNRVDEHSLVSDLKESAFTLCKKKINLILMGAVVLTQEEMEQYGFDTSRCASGAGGGTRKERDQDRQVTGAGQKITPRQAKRLWAIAYDVGKTLDWSKDSVNEMVRDALSSAGVEKTEDLTNPAYKKIVDAIQKLTTTEQPKE